MFKFLFLFLVLLSFAFAQASAIATVSITILPRNFGNITNIVYPDVDDIGKYLIKQNITNTTPNYINMSKYLDGLNNNKQNKTNISGYLNGMFANQINCNISNASGYFNCTYFNDSFNSTEYNATIPNATYFLPPSNKIIKMNVTARDSSQCQNSWNKDWQYYLTTLYSMGFDVSQQTQEFKDMIIKNMGENSYYHRCLRGY